MSPLAQEPLCSTEPEKLYMVALRGDRAHLYPRGLFLSAREECTPGFLHGIKPVISHFLIAL